MSESEAAEALLARLSYQASVRAGELARRAATKLPIYKVAKISFIFCLLVRESGIFLIFSCLINFLVVVFGQLCLPASISKNRGRNGEFIVFQF